MSFLSAKVCIASAFVLNHSSYIRRNSNSAVLLDTLKASFFEEEDWGGERTVIKRSLKPLEETVSFLIKLDLIAKPNVAHLRIAYFRVQQEKCIAAVCSVSCLPSARRVSLRAAINTLYNGKVCRQWVKSVFQVVWNQQGLGGTGISCTKNYCSHSRWNRLLCFLLTADVGRLQATACWPGKDETDND